MEVLQKFEKLNQLYTIYSPLLTKKQQQYFELYYYDNYSLQEVADYLKVSKNAVFDQLSKVEKKLEHFEVKLKVVQANKKRRKLLNNYLKTKELKYLEELKRMDE